MVPIFLDRFRDVLLTRRKMAVRTSDVRLMDDGRGVLGYIPFEYVTRDAQLVIVGITPGPDQLELAYEEAGRRLRAGGPDEVVLREAKRVAVFRKFVNPA
jgi:hypothetical protein